MQDYDEVNHPKHYQGKVEAIDAIESALGDEGLVNYCIGNAIKYLMRCNKKHESPVTDLRKALWYISKAVQSITDNLESNESSESKS